MASERTRRIFHECSRKLLRSHDPREALDYLVEQGVARRAQLRSDSSIDLELVETDEETRALADELIEDLLLVVPERVQLEALLHTLPDLVWLKDVEGRYLTCNARFELLMGAPRAAVVGKTDYDFFDRETADFFRMHDRRALAAGGPVVNEEWVTFIGDGHRELLETIKAPVCGLNGKILGTLGIGRDFTARWRSAHQLQLFAEHSPAAVAMFDTQMRYLMASRRYTTEFGLDPDRVLGRSHYELFPRLPEHWKEVHRRCLAGAVESCDEEHFMLEEGKPEVMRWEVRPWWDYDGAIGGIIIFSELLTARKQTEQALQERQSLWQAMLETAPFGIAVVDFSRLRLVSVNGRLCSMTGYEASELEGQSPSVIWPVRERAENLEAVSSLTPGEHRLPRVYQRKDGTEFHAILHLSVGVGGLGLAAVQDVEEQFQQEQQRVQTEQALRASERRFHLALDTLPLPVGLADKHDRFLYLNPAFMETYGYLLEDVPSLSSLLERSLPDREAREHLLDVLALDATDAWRSGQSTPTRSTTFVCKDGDTREVEITRRHLGTLQVTVFQDTTERSRSQAALLESEERWRLALDAVQQGTFRHDIKTDRVDLDARAMEHFGFTTGQVWMQDLVARCHPEDRPHLEAVLREVIASEGRGHVEHRIVLPWGEERILSVHGCVVRSSDGSGLKGIGTSLDVTEARRAEQALRQSYDKIQSSQRLEAIGRLAGGIAHDFNNLLTIILSCGELACCALAPDDPVQPDLEEIISSAHRAERLTRQLLAFGRQQVLRPVTMDLNELVSELARMLGRLIGEDIELFIDLAGEPTPVRADPGQLEQVLLNLAVNARDAMPEGGVLTVGTRCRLLTQTQAESLDLARGDYVELAVSDDGTGMDAETQARIFEPFFTTKAVGKGTGLGLSTVYGIVRQSEGAIRVESAPGAGCTFRIYLPRASAEAEVSQPEEPGAAGAGGQETILVVEDEAPVRKVVERALRGIGYHVLAAADASEALALAETNVDQIRLVLTDVIMPGMNGRELGQKVSALCPKAQVLFMSGYTDDRLERHDLQGNHFLPKPFDLKTLTEKVRSLLDEP